MRNIFYYTRIVHGGMFYERPENAFATGLCSALMHSERFDSGARTTTSVYMVKAEFRCWPVQHVYTTASTLSTYYYLFIYNSTAIKHSIKCDSK